MGEHRVRLLDQAVAVDDQRMVVKQHRTLQRTFFRFIPDLFGKEGIILQGDSFFFVEGDDDRFDRFVKRVQFLFCERGFVDELLEPPQMMADHHVGVGVVVDQSGVLVRAGHLVDDELSLFIERTQIEVEAGRFDQELQTAFIQDGVILCDVEVLVERIGDVRVDVVLGGSGGEVGGGLRSVDRPPREQGPFLGKLPCPLFRIRQHADPIEQQVAGFFRIGVGEERKSVDLRVPEGVTLIPDAGEALGRKGVSGRLVQLEDVEPQRQLQGRVVLYPDIALLPEPLIVGDLFFLQGLVGRMGQRFPFCFVAEEFGQVYVLLCCLIEERRKVVIGGFFGLYVTAVTCGHMNGEVRVLRFELGGEAVVGVRSIDGSELRDMVRHPGVEGVAC
ncbi:MAG: hypothetical protein BWY50_00953 [Spirochaetes bacterium ADurb.Bin315]|nr:MAG: hypothetical protein BWY50_00953 [Spirochaetes bacterium ADurb.Bin315]